MGGQKKRNNFDDQRLNEARRVDNWDNKPHNVTPQEPVFQFPFILTEGRHCSAYQSALIKEPLKKKSLCVTHFRKRFGSVKHLPARVMMRRTRYSVVKLITSLAYLPQLTLSGAFRVTVSIRHLINCVLCTSWMRCTIDLSSCQCLHKTGQTVIAACLETNQSHGRRCVYLYIGGNEAR